MKLLRPISLLAGLLVTMAGATAQISLTPPAAQPPASPPAAKKEAPKPKAPTAAKKPTATPTPTPAPAAPLKPAITTKPTATPVPSPSPTAAFEDPNVDIVYGAYQRGLYKTAFDLATTRAQYNGDPKAMTMLGELYANGLGIKRNYARAAELLRVAADAGNPEAQYALATFYKEGTGVPKDLDKAVRLLQAAALADNVDAEVEYAIALFNGTGTPKNQAAAVALLRKAARQNSPIAQNRLARVLVSGLGVPADKIEGLKWHLVAKTAGKGDPELDERLSELSPEDRAKVEAAARKWTGTSGGTTDKSRLDGGTSAGHPIPKP